MIEGTKIHIIIQVISYNSRCYEIAYKERLDLALSSHTMMVHNKCPQGNAL